MVRLSSGRIFWGVILAVLGISFLMNNLGYSQFDLGTFIGHYWPIVPIYFGLVSMYEVLVRRGFGHKSILWGSLVLNTLMTVVFLGVLGNINGWWSVDLSILWKLFVPAVLLVIGFTLMTGGISRPGARTYLAVMSGAKDLRTSWDDLSIINVMGGSKIDLTRAGLPDQDVMIDIYAIMGGGDLILPEGVTVVCEWTGIMGGVKLFGQETGGILDKQTVQVGEGPVVRVRALTVMGGFDIKRGF